MRPRRHGVEGLEVEPLLTYDVRDRRRSGGRSAREVTPEPTQAFEFSPELDRDLLALALDIEIHAAGELLKPSGSPAVASALRNSERLRAPERREEFLRRLAKG
jgi:hypothetical protein